MQDRLDGGISLLIRCAGYDTGANSSLDKVPIDLYITPRELQETPQRIGGDVAVWVQVFAQEFAMPHLHRFAQRCAIEKVRPPNCCALIVHSFRVDSLTEFLQILLLISMSVGRSICLHPWLPLVLIFSALHKLLKYL
jgi:hypothetical protein